MSRNAVNRQPTFRTSLNRLNSAKLLGVDCFAGNVRNLG
jgi:hypothetical protein